MWDGQATESLGVSGPVPDSLSATNTNGETVTLNQQQLTRAATIIATGESENIPARGQMIAIMTALTESSLRVLSNTGAYPDSGNIPNDGDGSDHDSVGLFQQRPAAGWGSVENLMDPVWSSRAFYGGPSGPNHGSPRGLLDIDGWAVDGSRRRGPGRPGLGLSRPVRRQPADRGEGPDDAERRIALERAGVRAAGGRRTRSTSRLGSLATSSRPPHRSSASRTSGAAATSTDPPAEASTAPASSCTPPTKPPADASDSPTTPATRSTPARASPWADKQPGDLIFFSYPGAGGPHHVAIYVGGDRILHAPRTGDVVRYGTIGEFAGEVMTVRRLDG